ncbi:MAG: hypothetical protein HYX65_02830 [Gemmatimonadetes bacterium]|nr:hypothetical protein [Gemmatimonadota bacterium]
MFVHGFWQNACYWNYVAPQLSNIDGTKGTLSLPTFASFSSQADEVIGATAGRGGGPSMRFVLVAHSLGGDVARLAAQRNPGMFRGSISIGAPHDGVPFVQTGSAFFVEAGALVYLVVPGLGPTLSTGLGVIGTYVQLTRCSVHAAMLDASPGSATLNAINAAPAIPGAAVVYHASNNWLFYRVVGDLQCSGCGPSWVRNVGGVYDGARICAGAGLIFGIVFPPALGAAYACGSVAAGIGGHRRALPERGLWRRDERWADTGVVAAVARGR